MRKQFVYDTQKVKLSTLDEENETSPNEADVPSLKSSLVNADGDRTSKCSARGDAHRGRDLIYNLATSIGEPASFSICMKYHCVKPFCLSDEV